MSQHGGRLMFAIVIDELFISEPADIRSHIEWFRDQGWINGFSDSRFETIVRGFVNGYGIFAYVGQDFRTDDVGRQLMAKLEQLQQQVQLDGSSKVWFGRVGFSVEQGMTGSKYAGTIEQLLDRQSKRPTAGATDVREQHNPRRQAGADEDHQASS